MNHGDVRREWFLKLLASAIVAGKSLRPLEVSASGERAFAEAKELIRRLKALDDAQILPGAGTNCYDHGRRMPLAVVLFHGFTNNPIQFARLAANLYARGCNVLVPRLPGHGDADRMSTRLEGMTAADFTNAANAAIDAARGLGSRLAVSGISLGGSLCAWLATVRPDIDTVVSVSPAIALNHVAVFIDRAIVGAMTSMPAGSYAWWDPKLKERILPKHAYPRYPIRTLGECYRIGEEVIDARGPFPGRGRADVAFALNPADGTVNDAVVTSIAQKWSGSNWVAARIATLSGVPPFHDIIEPEAPGARIDVVYPQVIRLVTGADQFRTNKPT